MAMITDIFPDISDMFKIISDCDMYLKFHYSNLTNNAPKSILLTPDELFKITVTEPNYNNLTNYMIENTKRNLPVSLSGLTITDYKKEGNDIVTYMIVDENVASFENMKSNSTMMKDTYLQTLKNKTEVSAIYSAYAIAKAGYNQVCICKGSLSGDSFSYKITSEEILNILE